MEAGVTLAGGRRESRGVQHGLSVYQGVPANTLGLEPDIRALADRRVILARCVRDGA